MKACLWEYVGAATHSYHDGAAVLIVAESVEQAKGQVPRIGKEAEPVGEPDRVWDVTAEPEVFIFPDSGCC